MSEEGIATEEVKEEEVKEEPIPLTQEQAKAVIEREEQIIDQKCQDEINEVLKKYKRALAPRLLFLGPQIHAADCMIIRSKQ